MSISVDSRLYRKSSRLSIQLMEIFHELWLLARSIFLKKNGYIFILVCTIKRYRTGPLASSRGVTFNEP